MCGGGGWDPGEATDDTQMAVLVAESLLERQGLDLPDIFRRFQQWAASEPKDIGLQTEDVLTNGMPWDRAADVHFRTNLRAAGNGSLMRASTSAVYFARHGQQATMDAARRIAALTHGDRAAWEGTAIFHELVRRILNGVEPVAALPDILCSVHPELGDRYATVLAVDWTPDQATEFNGAVWPCLGSAVWSAHHRQLRRGGARRDRPRRRHRHRRGGHRWSRGRLLRGGLDPGPLDRAASRPDSRLRQPRATTVRAARSRTPPWGLSHARDMRPTASIVSTGGTSPPPRRGLPGESAEPSASEGLVHPFGVDGWISAQSPQTPYRQGEFAGSL